jgi:hypothetical protein
MKEKGEIQAFLAKFCGKNEDSRFPDHSRQAKRAVREEETSLERAGCNFIVCISSSCSVYLLSTCFFALFLLPIKYIFTIVMRT